MKAAYRRLAKEWHPDRFHQRSLTDREAAEEKFKALTSAYRRIAGGWLEEETARGKSPPKRSPHHGAGETAGRSAGAGRHSAGPSPVFSWPGIRPGFLSMGLLLAVATLLFFIRFDSSSVRQDKMSPAAPDLPVGSSSLSAPLPDSDLENPPGIQRAPEPSPPSEA
ncbi:MAG: DnaJ domain-containing protein, partial [Syntrophobacteraceae bacterium]|nr:DnaJ domain-containing protein [Syntrophobacteraceae bacterium]